jgi:hypothetical protein
MTDAAIIKPWIYDDPETGDRIAISVSDLYSKLTINDREYYFIRESGEFDGTATLRVRGGPILVVSDEE